MSRFLSRKEVAERTGVAPDTLGRYRLPAPDAWIGTVRGWLPETIDQWHMQRPGRGARPAPEAGTSPAFRRIKPGEYAGTCQGRITQTPRSSYLAPCSGGDLTHGRRARWLATGGFLPDDGRRVCGTCKRLWERVA